MELLNKLFLLFLFVFPLGVLVRFQFNNGVAISVNDILVLILVCFWAIKKIRYKEFNKKYFLFVPLLMFVVVGFASLTLNILSLGIYKYLISFSYLLRFAFYVSLYFVVRDFSKEFKVKIVNGLFLSGLIFVVFGYLQYFFFPSLKNFYEFGWDEHLYRMTSTFLDPNFAGAFFVAYFIFSLNFVKTKLNQSSGVRRLLYASVPLLSLVAVYLTYSRSALIMLFVSLATYLMLIKKQKLIIAAFAVLLLLVFVSPRAFQTEGTNLLRIFSSEERIKSMQIAITLIQENPLTGVGFNAYRYAQYKHGLDGIYWQISHAGAGTDASLLFVLATTGVIGLIVFLHLVYKIIVLGKTAKNNGKVLLAVFVGLLIDSVFINSLFYVFILEWIIIMIGITENS